MADKEVVGVRLPQDTHQRVEEYAEEHGISKSDALRRMIQKGVDLEDAGLAVAATSKRGSGSENQEEEKTPITDGGSVLRPVLNTLAAIYSAFALLVLVILLGSYYTGLLGAVPMNLMTLLNLMISSLVVVALCTLVLYTDYPEQIDRRLRSGVRQLPSIKQVVK